MRPKQLRSFTRCRVIRQTWYACCQYHYVNRNRAVRTRCRCMESRKELRYL